MTIYNDQNSNIDYYTKNIDQPLGMQNAKYDYFWEEIMYHMIIISSNMTKNSCWWTNALHKLTLLEKTM